MSQLFTALHHDAQRVVAARADVLLTRSYNPKRPSTRNRVREEWLQRLAGQDQLSLPL